MPHFLGGGAGSRGEPDDGADPIWPSGPVDLADHIPVRQGEPTSQTRGIAIPSPDGSDPRERTTLAGPPNQNIDFAVAHGDPV